MKIRMRTRKVGNDSGKYSFPSCVIKRACTFVHDQDIGRKQKGAG